MKKIFLNAFFLNLSVITISQDHPVLNIYKTKSDAVLGINEIDKNLRITYPLLGQKVRGKILIKGSAKPGSFVSIKVSSTYYKLGADQQKRKIFKGEGPFDGGERTVQVKVNGQGFWSTDFYNFRNPGWSQEFKIVARSVEGKNGTYVIVKDETKPIVEWD